MEAQGMRARKIKKTKPKKTVAHEMSDEEKSQKAPNPQAFHNSSTHKVSWEAQPYGPKTDENKQKVVVTAPHTCEICDQKKGMTDWELEMQKIQWFFVLQ